MSYNILWLKFFLTPVLMAGFEKDVLKNNIAVIEADQTFTVGKTVIPACLPDSSNIWSEVDGKKCFAPGWGREPSGWLDIHHFYIERVIYLTNEQCFDNCRCGLNKQLYKLVQDKRRWFPKTSWLLVSGRTHQVSPN